MDNPWTTRILLLTFFAVGLGLVLSCDDDGSDAGDGDGDADSDVDIDVDVDVDGDSDSDSDHETDMEGDADEETGPFLAGTVILVETEGDPGVYSNLVSVTFQRTGGPECGVTEEAFGAQCSITTTAAPACSEVCGDGLTCSWNDACLPECLEPVVPYQAGDVIITGATAQPRVVCTFSEETSSYSCDHVVDADFWNTGDRLTAAATGDTFPYFSLYTDAPSNVQMLTNLETVTTTQLVGLEELVLEWYPGTARIYVHVTANSDDGARQLICSTDDDGSLTLPADGLSALAGSAPPTSWTIQVFRSATAVTAEGRDGQVHLYVVGTDTNQVIPAD